MPDSPTADAVSARTDSLPADRRTAVGPTAPWIVLKFGGTSVSRRHRWDTIGRLAAQRAQSEHAQDSNPRVLIVVSALSGVTNTLQAIADGQNIAAHIDALCEKHRGFCAELDLDPDTVLAERLTALRALGSDPRAAERALDWQAEALAQGELLSSTLGAAYLRTQGLDIGWCDARDWLHAVSLHNASAWAQRLSVNCRYAVREDNAAPGDAADLHAEAIAQAIAQDISTFPQRFAAQPTRILISQGFIARHADGGTAILGRGGSDTSAAYFGALLKAQRVEIWTDVPGMFSANPREVPDARLLARLDYAEAQEIATTGAKVLHPRSIAPCRDAGVPMCILDTERPHLPGTRIDGGARTVPGVKAISRRNGIVLVSMETVGMWQQVGFLADVFERFKRHGLSVDLIGSSETNVTVSLDPSENLVSGDVLSRLSTDLSEVCRVKVIVPCAAITLVGRGMRSLLHKLSEVWATFGEERVHLISQSSNDLNLTFVIDEDKADGLLAALHAQLIVSGAMPVRDAGVFGDSWKRISAPQSVAARPAPWWAGKREALLGLAAAGTPRYVYDLDTVRERARGLSGLRAVDLRFFALKANPHPAVLRTLEAEGFGFECVSLHELRHALALFPGIDRSRLLFTPSFAPRAEYAEALAQGVHVTLDNVEALQRWPELFRGRALWLRLDLGRGDGHHAKVRTGGADAKFGLPLARLPAFVDAARALDARIVALHAHLGSGIDSPAHWREVYADLAGLADDIGTVATLDIGGGLPIPYRPEDEPIDLAALGAGLEDIKAACPGYALAIEPGRYLVAEAGALLLRVTQVVEKDGVRRVGADAGMNALLRPALYDAWHGIHNLTRLDDADVADCEIVGPICESSDVLGRERPLPAATAEGDVLLIADAGAYGHCMSSRYNLRPLPDEDALA